MKKRAANYYVILLLIAMFAAPGVAAYLFYQHPHWLGTSRTNKGVLLTPAVALDSLNSQSKWSLVLVKKQACRKNCLQQLDLLARVRLALGRKFYQVDERLILGDKALLLKKKQAAKIKKLGVQTTVLTAAEMAHLAKLPKNMAVFIVNPDNYFVLAYPAKANPDDVYNDLKLLMNTTEQKSG
jgi:hypothetical protein